MTQIIILNKPFNTLCQFSDSHERRTLAHFIEAGKFADFYPAGRLDCDSEGMVILTNNGALQHRISHPQNKLHKAYWVQVEGKPSINILDRLRAGVELRDGRTLPAKVKHIAPPPVWQRTPPVRQRLNRPTSWLQLIITEGKNRQVRRMTAAVGHPTLRLIRYAIGHWELDALQPGEYRLDNIHLPQMQRDQRRYNKTTGRVQR